MPRIRNARSENTQREHVLILKRGNETLKRQNCNDVSTQKWWLAPVYNLSQGMTPVDLLFHPFEVHFRNSAASIGRDLVFGATRHVATRQGAWVPARFATASVQFTRRPPRPHTIGDTR